MSGPVDIELEAFSLSHAQEKDRAMTLVFALSFSWHSATHPFTLTRDLPFATCVSLDGIIVMWPSFSNS